MTNAERRILRAVADCGASALTLVVWDRMGGGCFLKRLFRPSPVEFYLILDRLRGFGWLEAVPTRPGQGERWRLTVDGRRRMEEKIRDG